MDDDDRMREEYDFVLPAIEGTPADSELEQETLQRAIALSRQADMMHKRAIERGERPPALVSEIRDFMLANSLPTALKERTGTYQPRTSFARKRLAQEFGAEKAEQAAIVARAFVADRAAEQAASLEGREDVVRLMREHWQDPAGFHEAIARLFDIEEREYAIPNAWFLEIGHDVIAAAQRIADVSESDTTRRGLWADISTVVEAILTGKREPRDD